MPGRASSEGLRQLAIGFLLLFLCAAVSPAQAQIDLSAGEEFVPGEVVLQLTSGADLSAIALEYKLDPKPLDQFGSRPIFRLRIVDHTPVTQRISELRADPQLRVIYAEPNYLVKPPQGSGILWSDGTPGDGVGGEDYRTQWATQKIQLTVAHGVSRGAGVRIAVLDTGVDTTHPALAGHLMPGYDFVDMDNDPTEEGSWGKGAYGHGTHVTGLVALVAPEAKIMPLRVLDENGVGNIWVLAEALEYAVNPDGDPNTIDGAHIISMSLSTPRHTDLLLNILRKVTNESYDEGGHHIFYSEYDTVVVASAGNSGDTTRQYPAAEGFHAMLAVGSSNEEDFTSSFSTRGWWVRALAPGENILSTIPGGGYAKWSGTSMAAPITAGVAALLRSVKPALGNNEVISHLLDTSKPAQGSVSRRIDAGAALTTAPKPFALPSTIQFALAGNYGLRTYRGSENLKKVPQIRVVRIGDDSAPASVDYATRDAAGMAGCDVVSGHASSRCDYTPLAGTLYFAPGERWKYVDVPVIDDRLSEGFETFMLTLDNPTGAILGSETTVTLIIEDNDPIKSAFQFSAANYSVAENSGTLTHSAVVTVQRMGDTSGSASVEVKTADYYAASCDPTSLDRYGNPNPQGIANARCDYTSANQTLHFAPGEAAKEVLIPIINDNYVEPSETVLLVLTNPLGASLQSSAQPRATLTITDDDVAGATNPINTYEGFVRQQYLDFLAREPESGGLNFYLDILNGCNASDIECVKYTKGALAANFFRSPEFQRKGSFVMYLYMITLGQRPSTDAELADPSRNTFERPHYTEFMADLQSISDANDDKAIVSAKKDALTVAWLQRAEIQSIYGSLSNSQFVQKIVDTAGVVFPSGYQNGLVSNLESNSVTRAQVLRDIAESPEVNARFYKPAFVTMQYFGFLRRDPDLQGYVFHNNRFQRVADQNFLENVMVRGFTESPEYFSRFGN